MARLFSWGVRLCGGLRCMFFISLMFGCGWVVGACSCWHIQFLKSSLYAQTPQTTLRCKVSRRPFRWANPKAEWILFVLDS